MTSKVYETVLRLTKGVNKITLILSEAALRLTEPEYLKSRRFTETGEASKEYMGYLDNNEQKQARAYEDLGRQLRKDAGLEGKVTKQ